MRSEFQEIPHDLSGETGEILLAWFHANPNGPTAWTVGFLDAGAQRRLFLRSLHFTRSRAWLIGSASTDCDPASAAFRERLGEALARAQMHFLSAGADEPPLLQAAPSFMVPAREAQATWAFVDFAMVVFEGQDWAREFDLIERFGPAFFARAAHETRQTYEELKQDLRTDPDFLAFLWARHQHMPPFANWQPVELAPRPVNTETLLEWLHRAANAEWIEAGAWDFAQMWVGAVAMSADGLLKELRADRTYVSFGEVVSFFERFGLPIFHPSWTDAHLCDVLGKSKAHL